MHEHAAEMIVIGAGSAGAIVATRLAEAGFLTLLLEAGPPDRNPLIHIPAGVRYLHGNPRVSVTDTASSGAQAGNRPLAWPHGRVLGGSGSINGMIFSRGAARDFDTWAALGCTGWGWDDVLPAFRRLETFRGPADPTRGTTGPLPVELPRIRFPVTARFVAAAAGRGHQPKADLNTGDPEGVGEIQMNRNGRFRASSARAFLRRGRQTGRLRIITGATVTALDLVPGAGGVTCRGVRFRRGGQTHMATAGREMILSAGAIDSAALLLRAGIGAAHDLRAVGIAPLIDLPGVGRNLQDHHTTRLSFRLRDTLTINQLARSPRLWWQALRFLTIGDGVLTTGVTAAQVYLRSTAAQDGPDLCLLFSPSSFAANRFGVLETAPGCQITVSICRPYSRGRLWLRDASPDSRPLIDAGHFSDARDLEIMRDGIAEARALMAAPDLQPVMVAETGPGAGLEGDALSAHIRGSSGTMFHYAGTCRMGTGPNTVVDARLRVHGTTNLRVVDAGIMPVITSGNTNAPVMMIGEQGAALIIADHRN